MFARVRALGRRRYLLLAGVAVLAVATGTAIVVARTGGGPDPVDHRYVVAAGTAARVEAGEPVEVLPARIELREGDSITLVNEDVVVHGSGFLVAPPDDEVTYRFNRAGSYVADCTLHPGGTLQIVVTSAA